jgi:hypothetical protein
LKFTYHDVARDKSRPVETALAVDVSRESNAVDEASNRTVVVEAALVEAERRHSAAVALYESGRINEAEAALRKTAASLTTMNETLEDVRLTNKIEALTVEAVQMENYAAAPAPERAMYSKRTK